MIEIGKLYYLAKDPTVYSYSISDTRDLDTRKKVNWIKAEKLEKPFLIIDMCEDGECYLWLQIIVEEQIGWINVEQERLRFYKTY